MNTRSMIFVIGLTAILFFVNQHFTSKRQQEYAEERKQQELVQKEQMSTVKQELEQRTASAKQLPLTRLFEDLQGHTFLSWSVISSDDSYLTMNWAEKMPKQIYVQKGSNFIPVHLITGETGVGKLSLYSAAHQPEIVSTYVPQIGMQDVQLVTFLNGAVQVTLAEYENGQMLFPAETPSSNAIAMYQLEGAYLPVGLYNAAKNSFQPMTNFKTFENLTTYRLDMHPSGTPSQEKFYVLENEYMQVVFSNWGGAIAEVNLPFEKTSSESVVLPISFDRIIDKKYPSNAHFPSRPFYAPVKGSEPVLKQPTEGGYYPMLRRGIQKGADYPPYTVPPQYYGFNIVSEDPETSQVFYEMTRFDENSIEFTANFQNRRITKIYSFPKTKEPAPYCLFASVKVDGDSRGLWVTSGVPEVELISGSPAPIIKYSSVQNQKSVVDKLSLPKESTTMSSIEPDWVANSNGYFAIIMDPLSEISAGFQANKVPGNLDPSRIAMIDAKYDLYPVSKYPGYMVHMPLRKTSQPLDFRLFMGPQEHTILKQVDATFTNQVTGYNPHYTETQSFHGWFSFISEPFAKFLFLIMNFFYKITHSWGFSIILLTIVLRIMMYPLNAWSIKSNLKLQALSPKMKKIQDKYKKDPKRQQLEMMQLYKQHKANPLGGCLPLIIQMPFLIGMFDLLKSTFSLRGASFIPGWIDNLTAPDVLFSWSYPIPFIGTSFHLLPILLGVVMFFQQKLMTSKNKEEMTDQQKQQQKMGSIMTIAFTVLFYKFPSGLNIYWFSSMLLQILQQWYASKRTQLKNNPNNPREVVINPKKSK
ncbi:membrane protein insertase YidC [Simkania negevensis]|nr:membrane protein insertase YidC [Simkania negevensis]